MRSVSRALRVLPRRTTRALGYVAAALARRLPERAVLPVGAAVGWLAWYGFPRRRRLARRHLARALPGRSGAELERIGRAGFVELGRNLFEWVRLPALDAEALRSRVSFEGLPPLRRAAERGRGVVLATAHYGNWELLPAAAAAALPWLDLAVVGRAFEQVGLQGDVATRRAQGGGAVLSRDLGELLAALRAGRAVGMLVDLYTPARRGGVAVPFFGARAWSHPGAAVLARRTGAALVPVTIRRIEGRAHRVTVHPEVAPRRSRDPRADVEAATAELARVLEGVLREEPVGWVWFHRKWKRSPDL